MIMIEILFWSSVSLIIYAYAGYPLVLSLLSVIFQKGIEKADIYPYVSLIISAYNEEHIIGEKIENSLSLDYPADRLEVIVVSDCSNDKTDTIASKHSEKGVKLIALPERRGKTAGLNVAIPKCVGKIIVFTDADAMFKKDALKKLVRAFNDNSIGFVSGRTEYITTEDAGIEKSVGIYARLERFVKIKESEIGSTMGADGAIFAIRSELYEPLKESMINDFVIPLQIISKGFRGILEDEATCVEKTASTSAGEYKRQVRITNRSIGGLLAQASLLNPFRGKLVTFNLISHKLLRWLVPFLMISAYFCNLILIFDNFLYKAIFVCHTFFYLSLILDVVAVRLKARFRPFSFFYQFCLINYAILLGWFSFFSGESDVVWSSVKK